MRAGRLRSCAAVVLSAGGVLSAVSGGGCSNTNSLPPPPPGSAVAAPRPSVVASASASVPAPIFNESDFAESDSNRDPFHGYGKLLVPAAETRQQPQYTVMLENYAIDELKLVAIISSGEGPRAMFIDPTGKGWVVKRGEHLGRGEQVKVGSGAMSTYPLYWKIDRIKPNEVVLVREDSLHPEVLPTYREVPLHLEGEKS